MSNKHIREVALGDIERTGNGTFTTYDGAKVLVDDHGGPSALPGIEIPHRYLDAKELRQIAKFLKALADQIDPAGA